MTEQVQQEFPFVEETNVSQLTPAGQLLFSFPDSVQNAIREYAPLAGKSIVELHDILQKVRLACGLAPWHPFTKYMKMEAQGVFEGRRMSDQNKWAVYNEDSFYIAEQDGSDTWIYIYITLVRGGEKSDQQLVAVSCKRNLLWSMSTERPLRDSIIMHMSDGRVITFKKSRIMRIARGLIKRGRTSTDEPYTYEHVVRENKRRRKAPKLPLEPASKTEADYKAPMFPFDDDIYETDDHVNLNPGTDTWIQEQIQKHSTELPPRNQGVIFTDAQKMLLKVIGDMASAHFDSIGAKETAHDVRTLIHYAIGDNNG